MKRPRMLAKKGTRKKTHTQKLDEEVVFGEVECYIAATNCELELLGLTGRP